jgi:hypothetical protein
MERGKRNRRGGFLRIVSTVHKEQGEEALYLERVTPHRGMTEKSYISLEEGIFSLDWTAFRCNASGQKADGYRHRGVVGGGANVGAIAPRPSHPGCARSDHRNRRGSRLKCPVA